MAPAKGGVTKGAQTPSFRRVVFSGGSVPAPKVGSDIRSPKEMRSERVMIENPRQVQSLEGP